MQDNNSTQPNNTDNALLDILQGTNITGLGNDKCIIQGNKFRSDILRQLAGAYRKNKKNSERYILEVILALDEAVEKGYLTNELFEQMKADPDFLKKI